MFDFSSTKCGKSLIKKVRLLNYVRLHLYRAFIYRNTRYMGKWICHLHCNLPLLTRVKKKTRKKRQKNSIKSIFPKWLRICFNKFPCNYNSKIQKVENPKNTGWPWLKQNDFVILIVASIISSDATSRYFLNQINPFTIQFYLCNY